MSAEDESPILKADSVAADNISNSGEPHVIVRKSTSAFVRFYETIKLIFGVELSFFLYCVAYGIFSPAQQNFIYQKICMYKFESEEICSQIDTSQAFIAEEDAVQADYSYFATISSFFGSLPALFVTLIMGAWADRLSFRVPLALPHLGAAAVTGCYVLFAYLPGKTLNPVFYGLFSVFSGLSGSATTIIMVCASYVSRITTGTNRTVRLGAIEGAMSLGATVGYLLNAFFLSDKNPLLAFSIQIAIHCYTIFFIFFMVRELHKFRTVKAKVISEAGGSWLRFIFVPRKDVLDAFVIFFGKSEKYAHVRCYLILMLFVFTIVASVSNGLNSVFYAFLTLQPISLSLFSYAIFQAANCIGGSLSLILGMRILRWLFDLSDATLLVIGISSRILGLLILGFGGFYPTYAPWLYCLATMGSLYTYVTIRSGLSKLTDESEHGRIFSALSLFENGATVFTNVAINALYAAMVSTSSSSTVISYLLHGFTIVFSAGFCIGPLMVAVWLGRRGLKNWSFHSSVKENALF